MLSLEKKKGLLTDAFFMTTKKSDISITTVYLVLILT